MTLLSNNELPSLNIATSYKASAEEISIDLTQQLGNDRFAFIILYFAPSLANHSFIPHLTRAYPDVPIFGCSTAGEMTLNGMTDGAVVALGFKEADFKVQDLLFSKLDDFSIRDGQLQVKEAVDQFYANRDASKPHCFALMLVDGLCYREEQLVSALSYGLRDIPLVGGSAGDGLNFKETSLISHGCVHKNAAVLLLVESRRPFHIFKCDSFTPTDLKFVVTKADPENRIVYELNAMPAATAYAKALGLSEQELDKYCLATHPLSVCFGGDSYVRSIKDVGADGSFSFYCAIDEGIVFTLSDITDMVEGLEKTFEDIHRDIGPPQIILGFDCVLRRMISEVNQSKGQISQLFKDHQVVGFNTYGEQVHAMHLNLTFSGIALGQ